MAKPERTVLTQDIRFKFWQNCYSIEDSNGCWIWQGAFSRYYGQITVKENGSFKHYFAHRISYMIHNNLNELTEGLVLHKCPGGGNASCVNPAHLYLGTDDDNIKDKVAAGRQPKGENIGPKACTQEMVDQIRIDYASGDYSMKELAKLYDIGTTTVWHIIHYTIWKD